MSVDRAPGKGSTHIDKITDLLPRKDVAFSLQVSIDGLWYRFEGSVPRYISEFHWSLQLPNWEVQVQTLETQVSSPINSELERYINGLKNSKGEVAHLSLKGYTEEDEYTENEESYLELRQIRSNTLLLPEGYGYRNAHGLGSFLLDNLLVVSDMKKWPVYGTPKPSRESKLSKDDLIAWYERKGFKQNFDERDYSMVRFPKEHLNKNQVISQLLLGLM